VYSQAVILALESTLINDYPINLVGEHLRRNTSRAVTFNRIIVCCEILMFAT